MKKLRSNLRKEEIAMSKGYMRWYRVREDEVRLFINESGKSDNNTCLNKLYYRNSRAELCINDYEYAKNFYEKHKHLVPKLFVKPDAASLYCEYEVLEWGLNENGIEVKLA